MNFNKDPLQCISFENPLDYNSYIIQKISAVVADTTDKAIVEAIIEDAKNDGVDELYLMDKHFIRNAIEKQMPKKVVPYNCGQFHCECGEIVKSYEKYCPECGQALDWSDT